MAEQSDGRQHILGFTRKEQECMEILLEPNIKTYQDGADRLGITLPAFKARMAGVAFRYVRAKAFCNQWEKFRRDRRKHKKGLAR